MKTPADRLDFLNARRALVIAAAEAAGLPGLTRVEREQCQAIAALAGLQLQPADQRTANDDLRRVIDSVEGLVAAIVLGVGVVNKIETGLGRSCRDAAPDEIKPRGRRWHKN